MKKTLLLMLLMFSSALVFAQTLNQPSQFNNVCDDNNDGFASFYMMEITSEIIGNNSNLVVTHHETQTDATLGVNPLPFTYFNSVPNIQTIYARVVNTVTNQVQIITYELHVNPTPTASPYTMTVCDDDNNGFTAIDIYSTIGFFLQGTTSNNVTFYETLTDAQFGMNPLPGTYLNTTPFSQVLHVRIQNMVTGCFSVTQLYIVITACAGQAGNPENLTACSDGPNLACFDLTVNTPNILGT